LTVLRTWLCSLIFSFSCCVFSTGNSCYPYLFCIWNLHCSTMLLVLYVYYVCHNLCFITLQVVRTSLMSCLLKTLKHNIDHPRPIKVLFETGNIYIFLVSVSNVVSHLKISTKKKQKKVTFLLLSVTLFVGTILFLLAWQINTF